MFECSPHTDGHCPDIILCDTWYHVSSLKTSIFVQWLVGFEIIFTWNRTEVCIVAEQTWKYLRILPNIWNLLTEHCCLPLSTTFTTVSILKETPLKRKFWSRQINFNDYLWVVSPTDPGFANMFGTNSSLSECLIYKDISNLEEKHQVISR